MTHSKHSLWSAPIVCALLSIPTIAHANGSEVFQRVCAECHGANGQGMPTLGPQLKGNSFVKSASDDTLKKIIQDGRKGKDKRYPDIVAGMPGQSVYDDDLDELIKYVHGDLQK